METEEKQSESWLWLSLYQKAGLFNSKSSNEALFSQFLVKIFFRILVIIASLKQWKFKISYSYIFNSYIRKRIA
jgi:hypothetical protein